MLQFIWSLEATIDGLGVWDDKATESMSVCRQVAYISRSESMSTQSLISLDILAGLHVRQPTG